MISAPQPTAIVAGPPPPALPEVPGPDPLRTIRITLAVIAMILVVAAITYLGRILEQVLIALFLYYAISPAARTLARHGVPSWVTYLLLLIVTVLCAVLAGRMIQANILDFIERLPRYQEKISAAVGKISEEDAKAITQMFKEASTTLVKTAVGTALSIVEAGLMIFFYLLFIILNSEKITQRIRKAFTEKQANRVLLIGQKINEGMQQYMKTKTLVSLGMGLTATIILYFFSLDYYLLWGFLFFALNYVTYVGSIVACVPPLALALLEFGVTPLTILLVVVIVANRIFWIDFIEIKLSGQSLNIDPLLLLLSLAYWGWFWGLVGLVLAVPMLTSLKIVLANIDETRPWAILISEE